MKKKLLLLIMLIAVAGSALGYYLLSLSGDNKSEFKTSEITFGNLENTISASGTLSPISAVEIGTQVSGTIAEVFVDYNDEVTKGQLLAVLDTVLLKASILDSEASVERATAQLEQAQIEHNKYLALYNQNLVSELDYLPYKIALKSQYASLKSAQASLTRATQNLAYAYITSPINGTVIEVDIEAGQTVAASLSTPTLFIIAENLKQMEILADVDESDIGEINEGQSVRFEVQAYSDQEFEGTVTQVRLQPDVISNVVTYTVVVDAANDQNLLLPGMTATIDFITESREDVLMVSNSALSFQPSLEIAQKFFESRRNEYESMPDSLKEKFNQRRQGMRRLAGMQSNNDSNRGAIWYYDDSGNITMEPVQTGMSDGKNTEIVRSRNLTEGLTVLTGYTSSNGTDTQSSNKRNMMMNRRMGGGPPPRF